MLCSSFWAGQSRGANGADRQPSNVQNAPCQSRLSVLQSSCSHTPVSTPARHDYGSTYYSRPKQRDEGTRSGDLGLCVSSAPAIKSTLPRGCPPRSGDGSRKHCQSSSQSKKYCTGKIKRGKKEKAKPTNPSLCLVSLTAAVSGDMPGTAKKTGD